MAREHNYLLGKGERLTKALKLDRPSRPKNPPYDFEYSRDRLVQPLRQAAQWAAELPADACPDDRVVLELTLHPRFLSKNDQPKKLLRAVEGKTIGRRGVEVSPEAWGTKTHPETAPSDKLYVAMTRERLSTWSRRLPMWNASDAGSLELTQVEAVAPATAESKLIAMPAHGAFMSELVLHNAGQPHVVQQFIKYARAKTAVVRADRQRTAGWLTFIPVEMDAAVALDLAQFAYVRAIRTMPRLRSVVGYPTRAFSFGVTLPEIDAISPERAVVFDGGLPENTIPALSRWVTPVEPPGIGPAHPDLELHGLAVTSSFLFGPLQGGKVVSRPACLVDHVRVLDNNIGSDLELYDVLDRITSHLDNASPPYRFGCLSLGPQRPIADDDVTAWTAELDSRLAHGTTLLAVAVGNDGDLDASLGLNRIQPPADGVNTFAIGACDSRGKQWKRAPYSCVGPGRSPGVFKPDALAFGGTDKRPFEVVGPALQCLGVKGTSFAAPFALRACASVASLVEAQLNPLTLRALAVHRAEPKAPKAHPEVGWGRLLDDPRAMMTCDDCESVVVYEGDLPLGQHLRARLALPAQLLNGKVQITATLAIAPEVDPEHASTYTRGGLGITFRPDATLFTLAENGQPKDEPETLDFFAMKRFKGRVPEYALRKDAHKWEPLLKASRSLDASKLNEPFFDIFYNRRMRGMTQTDEMPLRYALIVTVRCESVPDLYQQVLRHYATILSPLELTTNVTLAV